MPDLTTLPYDKYSELLTEACTWVAGLGVRYSATRLGKYERLWSKLADCLARGKLGEFFDAVPFPTFVSAAYDSTEIIEIYRGLRHSVDPMMAERLKESFKGHDLYLMDNSDRSGRDFGFELYIASRFASRGFSVDFSSDADVEVNYHGRRLYIECKRLKSPNKVGMRVKEGLDQLEKRYRNSTDPTSTDGILALSIAKVVNPALGMLTARSVSAVSELAGRHIDKFIADYGAHWQNRRGSNHLGAIIFLSSPSEVEGKRLFLTSQEVAVNNIAHRGTPGFSRLVDVSNRFFG